MHTLHRFVFPFCLAVFIVIGGLCAHAETIALRHSVFMIDQYQFDTATGKLIIGDTAQKPMIPQHTVYHPIRHEITFEIPDAQLQTNPALITPPNDPWVKQISLHNIAHSKVEVHVVLTQPSQWAPFSMTSLSPGLQLSFLRTPPETKPDKPLIEALLPRHHTVSQQPATDTIPLRTASPPQ